DYYQWWYKKKREFLLSVRDNLQALRPDLKLFYFPWHSDDDFPFSCGRLRYAGHPLKDKIYVPGTNILLVPSFTVPPEKWTKEQKKKPALARSYYREKITPELEGKVTLEDILYGRHKEMKEFWGAKRSGELPHLVYPHEMDLVKMFTEPGSMYSPYSIGCNPCLYKNDKGIIYWAPVHYKYTADNPEFLNLFKTGEGSAIGNFFPYNEETSYNNTYNLFIIGAIEHAGPFSMMEEVASMAHSDPFYIMDGMWEPVRRGFLKSARDFSVAFLSLPAIPSKVLTTAVIPKDKDIVVRQYNTDFGTYLAIINKAFDLKEKSITLTLYPECGKVEKVVDLVSGKSLPFENVPGNAISFSYKIGPMQLKSLRFIPETPKIAFRDLSLTSVFFSPNGDGRGDKMEITGRTVIQVTKGKWVAQIKNRRNKIIREFEGPLPKAEIIWDGKDKNNIPLEDGKYEIILKSFQFPEAVVKRTIVIDTSPPSSRIIFKNLPKKIPVNNTILEGKVLPKEAGMSLYFLQEGNEEKKLALLPDGSFRVAMEDFNLGENNLSFILEDAAENRKEEKINIVFELPLNKAIGFDFGAGPIMNGFSAIRNETKYSDRKGYGWIVYDNTWKGDRGRGDNLLRDYCSGKGNRKWAVRLPNGKYKVTIVMVDTRFPHFSADIYVEGKQVVKHHKIPKNEPSRPSFEVELKDEVMNFVFDNPGHLPYFALNGIIIEPM
ncbi:MAG: hypothetical protein ABIK53_02840, partial [bacterium]